MFLNIRRIELGIDNEFEPVSSSNLLTELCGKREEDGGAFNSIANKLSLNSLKKFSHFRGYCYH